MSVKNQTKKPSVVSTVEEEKPQETTTALVVPVDASSFAIARDGDAPKNTGQKKTPWVGFRSVKTASNLDALKLAEIEVGQFYLFDNEPIKVKPFTFHLLKFATFFTTVDDNNNTTAALREADQDQFKQGFRQTDIALVAVWLPYPNGVSGKLVPAVMTLRSGLSRALKTSIDLVSGPAADKDGWAGRSKLHVFAAQAAWPGGRFVTTIWGKTDKSQPNAEGKVFDVSIGCSSIAPTPPDRVQAFNALVGPGFQQEIVPAFGAYTWRCNQIEKFLPK